MKPMIFLLLVFLQLCNSSRNNYIPSQNESFTIPKSPFISEQKSSRNYNLPGIVSKNEVYTNPKSPFVTTNSDDTAIELVIRETQKQEKSEDEEEEEEIPKEDLNEIYTKNIIQIKSKRKQKKLNANKKTHEMDQTEDDLKMDTTFLFQTSSQDFSSPYYPKNDVNGNNNIIAYEDKEFSMKNMNCKKGCHKLAKILGYPFVLLLKFPDVITFITWLLLNYLVHPIYCSESSNTSTCEDLQIATKTFEWTAIVTFIIRIFILITQYFKKKIQKN